MADLAHQMGGDFTLSATGDLLTVSGADATQQRVIRRLLTNPGAYIWHLGYGAGLARFVGQPASADRITGVIMSQMELERGVGPTPAPTVSVRADTLGYVTATMLYADQATGLPTTITVTP